MPWAGARRFSGGGIGRPDRADPKGRRPPPAFPVARIDSCRCFLPDLAEFTVYRRGGRRRPPLTVRRFPVRDIVGAFHARAKRGGNAETGGERGIRTLDTGLTVYTLSRRAPSTARPSLRCMQACLAWAIRVDITRNVPGPATGQLARIPDRAQRRQAGQPSPAGSGRITVTLEMP